MNGTGANDYKETTARVGVLNDSNSFIAGVEDRLFGF